MPPPDEAGPDLLDTVCVCYSRSTNDSENKFRGLFTSTAS